MSTRSHIGIQKEDGSIDYIYCHFDGYQNLDILKKHYSDKDKIEKLIAGGDISSLGKNIDGNGNKPDASNIPEQTVFYHRDRGDELNVNTAESLEEFKMHTSYFSYALLYRDGQWSNVLEEPEVKRKASFSNPEIG